MSSDVLNIGVLGADGRMGGAVINAIHDRANVRLCAALTAPHSPNLGQNAEVFSGIAETKKQSDVLFSSDIKNALNNCDVIIDFSTPKAAIDTALAMHDTHCHTFVTGTTGYSDIEENALIAAAQSITLLKSGNFSLGVNMLEALIELTASRLKIGWDIEISEIHHKHKVDAPSGTALMLGRAAAKGRAVKLSDVQTLSRDGQTGPRPEGNIGFASLRGGGVIGAHDIHFASELEMLSLSHQAFDRRVFAQGAVTAAIWAAKQPKGLYDMKDVLGL